MTPAVETLQNLKLPFVLHQFDNQVEHDYARHAADYLGIAHERVFKTLICQGADKALLVAIVPATHNLNMKLLARSADQKKVEMAEQKVAQARTGYLKGAISPIGQKLQLPTYLDRRATAHPQIFVSGGRRGLEIEITPTALVAATNATIAALTPD
ncbi:MAG: Cys-tRNA(Pro) deacylase [Pseudomonadota bacterium]